ncbi:DUF7782 domain-containing protein [Lolliginicoccus suaedae]|uniref:DUF7782 domain-containing protein n=1 Tax=Lolliginicoccus suaedae TaxID=2605429 RepID=UPI001F3D2F4F|nr:methyltransferase [Lolliginicoccus suaedae]
MTLTAAHDLVRAAPALREAFEAHGYDADGLIELLGSSGMAALDRGEPAPIRAACEGHGPLGILTRMFILGDAVAENDAAAALAPMDLEHAITAGYVSRSEAGIAGEWDIRPLDAGSGTRWMISDPDGSLRLREPRRDHVLGVGAASLSLLRATPARPVGTLLDVGTGCGIQAIHAATYSDRIVATDVSERALLVTRAALALNGLEADVRHGSWFEPVAGEQFDQIVANPPFVVGGTDVELVYRDSGLELDGASEVMVRDSIDHLRPGGIAVMLASWVHLEDEDWRARVASWLPAHGVDAWIVQRDVADPDLYVSTWLRDADADLRDPRGQERQHRWLAYLRERGVEGIGFGFVFLRRTDAPSDILCEDLMQGFEDPLGDEALDYLDRVAWLRDHDVLDARLALNPTVALEKILVPGEEGWVPSVTRVHRGDGPRWQHEIDELGTMVLAGVRPDGLPLGEVVELAALATGEDPDEVLPRAVALAEGLVRHGILVPADLVQSGGQA